MIALWMLYSTFIAAVVGVAASVIERVLGETHDRRRWSWAVALVLSMAIPAWVTFTSATRAAAPTPVTGNLTSKIAGPFSSELASRVTALLASANTEPLARYDTPFVIVWMVGAVIAIAIYLAATVSLARRRRAWRGATVEGQRVLITDTVGPAVVGAIRPEIVVPEWSLALPPEERALMIEHERQHVSARDPLLLHVAALVALLMPWNIAVWWLNRRLRLAVELDCDARVLSRGNDARTYGGLLLHVCARRTRAGAMLAPALFERSSSLTKRVLAMTAQPSPFRRTRFALGAALAAGIIAVACETPTPEMLAPDGKDVQTQRLVGKLDAVRIEDDVKAQREMVARSFPSVARGEGGAAILFVVKNASGDVALAEFQPAEHARLPEKRTADVVLSEQPRTLERKIGSGELSKVVLDQQQPSVPPGVKIRGSSLVVPTGVGALRPDDIATVDVSKHAAGVLAPNPVSIVTIVLKPGAKVAQ